MKSILVVILGFAGVIYATALSGAEQPRPLNFVVILADDLGAPELGCYGNQEYRTPHLDRLAQEGTRFRTCYATPICSPSRVMLMTGRYGFRTGWYNFTGRPGSPTYKNDAYDLGAAELTFADVLKSAGYVTALSGKWQLTGKNPTLIHDCGFDEYMMWAYKHNLPDGVEHTGAWEDPGSDKTERYWNPSIVTNGKYRPTTESDYGPDLFNDFVIDFIRRNKQRPFLAYDPVCLVHRPWRPTPDLDRPGQKTAGGLKHNVEYLDHLVGKLVQAIDDEGLRENTVIFFMGDNGTQGAGKGVASEMGARVPFIVRCPGTIREGIVSDELVDLTDVFPTLVDFAKANNPPNVKIDGVSLAPTLRGDKATHRDWIFSYLHDRRILRDKRWLLEGDASFFDCGDNRDGVYTDVTQSQNPDVRAARHRFDEILKGLPAPTGLDPDPAMLRRKVAVPRDSE